MTRAESRQTAHSLVRPQSSLKVSATRASFASRGFARMFSSSTPSQAAARTLSDFSAVSIDGDEVPLSKYKGKVTLVTNVASK